MTDMRADTLHSEPVADEFVQPQRVLPSPPVRPTAGWVARGFQAMRDGRLPYRVGAMVDRILSAAGLRYKYVRVHGLTFRIRRNSWDENTVQRVVAKRDYERPGHRVHPADTVIDIGANIGCFAVVAGRSATLGRVLAFEPDRENFRLLQANVRLNGLSNVHAEQVALSGKSGTTQLFHGTQGSLHTTVARRLTASGETQDVAAVTLPDIFDRYAVSHCAFLKMNCEGAEYEILYNTPPDYLRRVERLALEYHASENKERVSRELALFLIGNGFEVFEFTDFIGFDCGYIRAVRKKQHPDA